MVHQSQFRTIRRRSGMIAFCGVMAALSVVLMLLGGIIPLATYISPLLGGALLLPVMLEYGRRPAWVMWLAVSLLTLLLGADREAAFFYLFVGYYPLLKPTLDKIPLKPLRLLAKLGFFALAVGAMYGVLCLVLRLDAVLAEFAESAVWVNVLFFLMMLLCLLLYDFLLKVWAVIYTRRLRPRLKFLTRRGS